VDTGLGDDVHVQAVAEIDRVDVVAFQVRVHDGEEHLQEEVDGIEQDREEEQPASGVSWYAVVYMYGMFRSRRTKLLRSFWRYLWCDDRKGRLWRLLTRDRMLMLCAQRCTATFPPNYYV
jgi:hypothetical protein